MTNEPKGDATVTYEDPHAAFAAVEWFNNKEFYGNIIGVHIAESKSKDDYAYNPVADSSAPVIAAAAVASDGVEENPEDVNGGAVAGGGAEAPPAKAWQQDGDWMCPNTRSVM